MTIFIFFDIISFFNQYLIYIFFICNMYLICLIRRGSSGSVASSSSPCGSAGSRRGSLGSPTGKTGVPIIPS